MREDCLCDEGCKRYMSRRNAFCCDADLGYHVEFGDACKDSQMQLRLSWEERKKTSCEICTLEVQDQSRMIAPACGRNNNAGEDARYTQDLTGAVVFRCDERVSRHMCLDTNPGLVKSKCAFTQF